jgi:hypothetical protein
VRLKETRPALQARQIVDLETPAVLAASDKLSMVSFPRCECHGNVAVNGLRVGFLASGALVETLRDGENLSAMHVSEAACGKLWMASLLVAWCATATLPATI